MRLTFPALQPPLPSQAQPNNHSARISTQPKPVDQVVFSGQKRAAEEELSDTEKVSQTVSRTSIGQDSSSRRETELQNGMTSLMAAARDGDMETLRQLYMTLRSIAPGTFRDQQDKQGKTALHHAIENNRLKAAKALLDGGANKTVEDASKHTPITRAAVLGNVDALKLLCTKSLDFNPPQYFAQPLIRQPLNAAVEHDQFEAASFLLSQGALPNSLEDSPNQDLAQTPLMAAARQNNPEMIDLLLSHGAEIEFEDEDGKTALTYAARDSQWASVEKLLNHQANLEPAERELQEMLVTACENNDVEQIRFLIKHGVRPADATLDDTPVLYEALQQATRTNDLKTAKLLLAGGLKPDSSSEVQTPAIVLAAESKNRKMVELLLRFGADVDAQSPFEDLYPRETALHMAAKNNDEPMVQLLMAKGADIEVEDSMGQTAFTHAIEKGHNALAKKLHENYHADLNWDFEGIETYKTPMLVAAERGNIEMLGFMLDKGVDPNQSNYAGTTPLMWAKDRQTAQRLIQAGANVNALDEGSETPLMNQAIQNNTDVMDFLIQQGAQLEETDEYGDTALFKAATYKHPEAVKLLIRRRANVHHENNSGDTALTETLNYSNGLQPNEEVNATILNALLEAGANINHSNDRDLTALHFAAVNMLPLSTETLLRRETSPRGLPSVLNKAAVTIQNQPALTDDALKVLSLLIEASPIQSQNNEALAKLLKKYVKHTHLRQSLQRTSASNSEIAQNWETSFSDVKKLLEAGVNAKLAEPSIFGTLQYAAQQNQDDKVEFLLKKEVSPDGVYGSDRSALMQAAHLGNTRTAQVLLKHKADPNLCNISGDTPFRLATQKGCINTMLRLLQAGADPAPHIDHEQDSDDEGMDVDDSHYRSLPGSPLANRSKPYPLLSEEERRDIAVSWPLKLKHPKVKAYVESLFPASLTWNLQTATRP